MPQAFANLKPGGHFLMSGIIKDKYALVTDALKAHGLRLTNH
ncbi:ribosomal protein L11 methyltransferase [Lentilactobacillus farraginis DSM 18382 = JCM 14108]|uniref:Ribosomal protein L11 methyltransferase n=1 Tax=Lentilactobacillus farraginis DSM 18382 = JCM 14108 TaxID=1423743 RepID=X0PEZ6_9LACO|nr:ribosomal protein L11 methyltransferase [Lentilactobacillus farraginis DSM 18382 = JCM 14108]